MRCAFSIYGMHRNEEGAATEPRKKEIVIHYFADND